MAVPPLAKPPDLGLPGAYLTDGKDLFCVVANHEGLVALEDCVTDRVEWVRTGTLFRRGLRKVSRGRG